MHRPTILDLPNELLLTIFSEIEDQPQLAQLALVNHRFADLAQSVLLSSPTFKGPNNFIAWLEIIQTSSRNLGQHVKELTLVSTPYHWDFMDDVVLAGICKACPKITLLDLEGCVHLTDTGVRSISDSLPDLSHLCLSHCNDITDKGIVRIAAKCHQLRILELREVLHATDRSLREIVKNCPLLESLDLAATRISDRVVRMAIEQLKHLTHLDLSCCFNLMETDTIIAEAPEGLDIEVNTMPRGPEDWADDAAVDDWFSDVEEVDEDDWDEEEEEVDEDDVDEMEELDDDGMDADLPHEVDDDGMDAEAI
ncbi:hypothetical protein HDV00_006182 [Rhizophlyctis rosea]|nr:hypothetical protein HDV00_006182 [Rhizophlyctis rosea]